MEPLISKTQNKVLCDLGLSLISQMEKLDISHTNSIMEIQNISIRKMKKSVKEYQIEIRKKKYIEDRNNLMDKLGLVTVLIDEYGSFDYTDNDTLKLSIGNMRNSFLPTVCNTVVLDKECKNRNTMSKCETILNISKRNVRYLVESGILKVIPNGRCKFVTDLSLSNFQTIFNRDNYYDSKYVVKTLKDKGYYDEFIMKGFIDRKIGRDESVTLVKLIKRDDVECYNIGETKFITKVSFDKLINSYDERMKPKVVIDYELSTEFIEKETKQKFQSKVTKNRFKQNLKSVNNQTDSTIPMVSDKLTQRLQLLNKNVS